MIFFGGSFDPWHIGHQQILEYISKMDEVIVGVSYNPNKNTGLYSIDERIKIIKSFNQNNVIIKKTPKYIVNFIIKNNIDKVVIGADTWNSILEWRDIHLLYNIEFLIIKRNEKIIDHNLKYKILDLKTKNISSSEIRKNIRENNKGEYYEKK